jgi:hypothetical protein
MAHLRTITIMASSATTNIPKMMPNATTSDASHSSGRNESSVGKNAMAPVRVEEHKDKANANGRVMAAGAGHGSGRPEQGGPSQPPGTLPAWFS